MKKISSFLVLSALALSSLAQVKHTTKPSANLLNGSEYPKVINPEKNTPWPYKQSVNCSIQDKKGDIWFGTTNGLYRYDGKIFTNYKTIEGVSTIGITKLMEDHTGNIFFGAPGAIIRYNPSLNQNRNAPTFVIIKLPAASAYANFTTTPASGMYGTETTQPINNMMEDSKGVIWFTSGYQLYYIDKITDVAKCTSVGSFLKSEKIQMSKGYPDDFGITGICEDTKGNMLICAVACAYGYNVTYSITNARMNHDCILNTCHHDLNNTKDLAAHNSEIASSFKKITLENSNTNMAFGAVLKDKHGNMLFGVIEKGGVYKLNGEHFTTFSKNTELNNSIISTLFEDSKGNIWMGTYADSTFAGSGVFRYNPTVSGESSIVQFGKKDGLCNKHPFSNDVITVINEDKIGKIWLGGDAGICYYIYGGQKAGNFTNFRKSDGMNDDHVNFILKAKSGDIWLGTWNLGIYKFDGKKLISFNE